VSRRCSESAGIEARRRVRRRHLQTGCGCIGFGRAGALAAEAAARVHIRLMRGSIAMLADFCPFTGVARRYRCVALRCPLKIMDNGTRSALNSRHRKSASTSHPRAQVRARPADPAAVNVCHRSNATHMYQRHCPLAMQLPFRETRRLENSGEIGHSTYSSYTTVIPITCTACPRICSPSIASSPTPSELPPAGGPQPVTRSHRGAAAHGAPPPRADAQSAVRPPARAHCPLSCVSWQPPARRQRPQPCAPTRRPRAKD